MKINEEIKVVTEKANYIPNRLMDLELFTSNDLVNVELENKRGYTLKTLPSNIREVYEKQSVIHVLNEKR